MSDPTSSSGHSFDAHLAERFTFRDVSSRTANQQIRGNAQVLRGWTAVAGG